MNWSRRAVRGKRRKSHLKFSLVHSRVSLEIRFNDIKSNYIQVYYTNLTISIQSSSICWFELNNQNIRSYTVFFISWLHFASVSLMSISIFLLIYDVHTYNSHKFLKPIYKFLIRLFTRRLPNTLMSWFFTNLLHISWRREIN